MTEMPSLPVARRVETVPKISLDSQPQGFCSGHMQRADVSGPGAPNAFPAMMKRDLLRQPTLKVLRLADVDRIPSVVHRSPTENVHARYRSIDGTNLIELHRVSPSDTGPLDGHD